MKENQIKAEAQKELLKELIHDWYYGKEQTAFFGNYMTKKLRNLQEEEE